MAIDIRWIMQVLMTDIISKKDDMLMADYDFMIEGID
jgi:hypothetical protein